jgi:AcrR family transcriptional regulator
VPSPEAFADTPEARPPTGRPGRATNALSERVIVEAALALLAEHGVEGLTMRELSSRLGVALGATYRHVRSKHELLRLVTQELYSRIEPGDQDSDGFAQAREVMTRVHDLLGFYSGLAGYIGHHMGDFDSAPLSKLVIDPLRSAGLSEGHATRVTLALTVYTSGHLLIRESLPQWDNSDQYRMFVYGLDLLLDGARARIRLPPPAAVE